MISQRLLLAVGWLRLAFAQFPPPPKGVTILKSRFHENVTISYKQPGICETTPGVKSYSGYVHLPPGTLDDGKTGEKQDYPINTFFWFFEARKAPEHAPLAIWLNGGPGGSSLMGLLGEMGPCFVTADSKDTYLNPWSWNNEVNLLFLDQPNQVGFSYDELTNGTLTVVEDGYFGPFSFQPVLRNFTDGEVPESNITYFPGTFSSQRVTATQNSTSSAAHAFWHFAQTWFVEFPHYKPEDNRISLWAESYGGHYGPGFFHFLQQQNDKIRDGTSKEKEAHYLHLDTLGIVNGLIDYTVQGASWPHMAYNNTYGIEVINKTQFDGLMHEWSRPGGCKEITVACQAALKKRDGNITAFREDDEAVKLCSEADLCSVSVLIPYAESGRAGLYDIAHPLADPFPPPVVAGYLAQASVQAALGVPLNFTLLSVPVHRAFVGNFDEIRGGSLEAMGQLLDAGVSVHMMYGDRDWICNWIGGEAASLAVPHRGAAAFARAGYAPLATPEGVAGLTRQRGNFSFTRVFQAGHQVPRYQPAAAYAIFTRATFHRDVATGRRPVTDGMATTGPADTWAVKNVAPAAPRPRCYILWSASCLPEVWETVLNGTAVVKDWYVVEGEDGEDAERVGLVAGADETAIDEL